MNRRTALLLRGIGLGIVLALAACSLPKLAYNNADSLVRFTLYDYFDPTQEQDIMMSDAVERLHTWHRRNELSRYADGFEQLAQRVEAGLQDADLRWAHDLLHARYRTLSARAVDDALPILRTLNADNFAALERKFAERNDDYAEEFLSGNDAQRSEAMVDYLEDHLERWVDDLTDAQIALLARFVQSQPRFAELRLENRRHLQRQLLAALHAVARGQPGADNTLRNLAASWEEHSTPQYRQALRDWEIGMRQTLVALDRGLSATQRSDAVARLRQYSSDLYALVGNETARPATARAPGAAHAMP